MFWRIYPNACISCSKMSQSDAHKNLVVRLVNELESRYPRILIVSDVQQNPGDPVPPVIDGFRPDVYASQPNNFHLTIIAEAKTDGDLDNQHTHNQLLAFINHLERKGEGLFVLSVTGRVADKAKTLLRFLCQMNHVSITTLAIFDGCDFWKLPPKSGVIWHLI